MPIETAPKTPLLTFETAPETLGGYGRSCPHIQDVHYTRMVQPPPFSLAQPFPFEGNHKK